MAPSFHSLDVRDLRYVLSLGCTAEERARPQEVGISVEIRFSSEPLGVRTDNLRDTVCFGELAEALGRHFTGKEYHLIERIAGEVYEIVRELAARGSTRAPGGDAARGSSSAPGGDAARAPEVAVRVHKLKPPVSNLVGGAIYACGDFRP